MLAVDRQGLWIASNRCAARGGDAKENRCALRGEPLVRLLLSFSLFLAPLVSGQNRAVQPTLENGQYQIKTFAVPNRPYEILSRTNPADAWRSWSNVAATADGAVYGTKPATNPQEFFALHALGADASANQLVNVKDTGAVGNGQTDDTAALQAAITQVASNGTVFVPPGTYLVNALTYLKLKSYMTLKLAPGATLKALPNNATDYRIVSLDTVNSVNVIGGVIQGDLYEHTGATGDHGMGLRIQGATNVCVANVTARDCWGDGFYIGGKPCSNITLVNVTADNNRRQGLSITWGESILVRDSTFRNTGATQGTAPKAGIDIEPNVGNWVKDVVVLNSQLYSNWGAGLQLYGPAGPILAATVSSNYFHHNNIHGASTHSLTNAAWLGNLAESNTGYGIFLYKAISNVVAGNSARQNTTNGFELMNATGNTLTNNWAVSNASFGLFLTSGSTGNVVTANSFLRNGTNFLDASGRNQTNGNTYLP